MGKKSVKRLNQRKKLRKRIAQEAEDENQSMMKLYAEMIDKKRNPRIKKKNKKQGRKGVHFGKIDFSNEVQAKKMESKASVADKLENRLESGRIKFSNLA